MKWYEIGVPTNWDEEVVYMFEVGIIEDNKDLDEIAEKLSNSDIPLTVDYYASVLDDNEEDYDELKDAGEEYLKKYGDEIISIIDSCKFLSDTCKE